MPTPRKPIDLQTKKMSKADRKAAKEAEIKLGDTKYTAPIYVKSNPEAFKKWKEITRIYKDTEVEFVTSSDNGVMGRYCLVYSEYIDLVEKRNILSNMRFPDGLDELQAELEDVDANKTAKLFGIMNYLVSTKGVMDIDKSINSKLKTLLDLENVLFLNPLSKIRSVPVKTEKEKKDEAADGGFNV